MKDQAVRDRLKAIQSAIGEKREERKALVATQDAAKDKFATVDVPVDQLADTDDFKAAEQAVTAVRECDESIERLQATERGILQMLSTDSKPSSPGNGPSDEDEPSSNWDPDRILGGDEYRRFIESDGPTSKAAVGTIQLGRLADRSQTARFLAADITSDEKQGAIPADRRGIMPPHLKRLSLLDLFPIGTTDSNVVEYVQILTLPDQAAEVEETAVGQDAALKPEASFTTNDAEAPARTIAHWLKVRRQALADVAGLQTTLGVILPHGVRKRLEAQIIAGDGEDQNIQGILDTPGIGSPEFVADDNMADAIMRAITTVVLADADPNFVALHPNDHQRLLLMRENEVERTGAYLYGSPAALQSPSIWGLQMVSNRAVPEGSPLVGDSMGAAVLVREGVSVRVSDSDGDDFRRNRVTLLAEMRAAFPVYYPTSFAVATPTEGS